MPQARKMAGRIRGGLQSASSTSQEAARMEHEIALRKGLHGQRHQPPARSRPPEAQIGRPVPEQARPGPVPEDRLRKQLHSAPSE